MIEMKYVIEVKKSKAKRYVPVRIDIDTVAAISELGHRFGFNLSEYIRTAVDERLERDMQKIRQAQYA